MVDSKDTKQTTEASAKTKLSMTSEDAVNSLMFRVQDQRNKYEGQEMPPLVEARVTQMEATIRQIDGILQTHPNATLQEILGQLSGQLKTAQAGETRLKIEATISEIKSLQDVFGGDVSRLREDEREYVLSHRRSEVVGKEADLKLIEEALAKGIYRTHFSGTFEGTFDGFHQWESKVKAGWTTLGVPNPLRDMIAAVHTTDYLDDEFRVFLCEENARDAVYIVPETNLMPDAKESVFPGTSEYAVRIMYATIVHKTGMPESYTDEHGRPGNHFAMDMLVPMSVAEKIVAVGRKDPEFYRRLAKSAVLDPEFGLEAVNPGIKIKDKIEGVYAGKDAVRNFKGLPPYEDADWKDSKMLVSADLKVREEKRDIVDTSRWPRETKIRAGIGALRRYMVRP